MPIVYNDHKVLAPHLLFKELQNLECFADTFGDPDLWEIFWAHVQDEVWFREHPQREEILANPRGHVPFVLHGDDAPCSRRVGRNINLLSMHCPLGRGHSTDSRKILLSVLPNDDPMSKMMHKQAKRAIVWSLNAASKNQHPADWIFDSEPPKFVADNFNQTLCPTGPKLTFIGDVGDWDWFAKDFELEWHFNKEEVCAICHAKKHGLTCNMANASPTADWLLHSRSLQDYLDTLIRRDPTGSQWNPLVFVRGFHTHSFFEDQLHADCLGIRQHANGSCLLTLCEEGVWGDLSAPTGSWDDKLDFVLQKAYDEFNAWCAGAKLEQSQPKFRALTLSLHKKSDFPILKSKGKNSVVLTRWLMQETQRSVDAGAPDASLRFSMLWGLNELFLIPEAMRPRFIFTDEELLRIESARKALLMGFHELHKRAALRGQNLFNVTPKFHAVDHMVRRGLRTRVSWHLFWCFASEDAIGSVAKVCAKTHGATTSHRVLQRWLVFFWSTFCVPG